MMLGNTRGSLAAYSGYSEPLPNINMGRLHQGVELLIDILMGGAWMVPVCSELTRGFD